jgi:saccharopine dehydrogenase-like NADP-dependent oxidoreductase
LWWCRLEVLPNRNSLKYGELYGIPDASTIFRGTLRYQGWSQIMHGCRALGLFNPTPLPQAGLSWRRLLAQELGLDPKSLGPEEEDMGPLERAMLQRLCLHQGEREARKVVAALRWLGALSEHTAAQGHSSVDAFVSLLEDRLRYQEDERDMVLMRHDIEVALDHGRVREKHVSSLLAYGTQQDSAMARTVGLTCAMAAELLLQGRRADGTSTHCGVLTPLTKDMYDPLLKKLADEGLRFKEEKTVTLGDGTAPEGRAHACL